MGNRTNEMKGSTSLLVFAKKINKSIDDSCFGWKKTRMGESQTSNLSNRSSITFFAELN